MSVAPTPDDPLYSVKQVAAMFGVQPSTVRHWITTGKMNSIKVMGRWRILKSEVVRVVNEEHG